VCAAYQSSEKCTDSALPEKNLANARTQPITRHSTAHTFFFYFPNSFSHLSRALVTFFFGARLFFVSLGNETPAYSVYLASSEAKKKKVQSAPETAGVASFSFASVKKKTTIFGTWHFQTMHVYILRELVHTHNVVSVTRLFLQPFQTPWSCSRRRGAVPDAVELFQTQWSCSGRSGAVPDAVEPFQT
jgi:hypothetical protein